MLNHEAVCAYMEAAFAALHCANYAEFYRLTGIADGNVYRWKRGINMPAIGILRRVEARSGVSLDLLDPRLNRGLAHMRSLGRIIRQRGWSMKQVCVTVGIGRKSIHAIIAAGECLDTIRATEVVALCDMVEGRLHYGAAPTPRAKRCAAKTIADIGSAQEPLPSEAHGDRFYPEALRVFGRLIHPLPELFHLESTEPGCVEGYGTELKWRVEKTPGGTTVTAMWRKNGRVCGQWTA